MARERQVALAAMLQRTVAELHRRVPDAYRMAEDFRRHRGRGGWPDWPRWCFTPMSAYLAAVDVLVRRRGGPLRLPGLPPEVVMAHFAGLLLITDAWRVGQGIYWFDEDLARELIRTPMREVPAEHLLRLPEWGVYIPLPDPMPLRKRSIVGVWLALDWNPNTGIAELVIGADPGGDDPYQRISATYTYPLLLSERTVPDAVDALLESSMRTARKYGAAVDFRDIDRDRDELERLFGVVLPLALYLCSEEPDITERGVPARPVKARPRRTKKGLRWFPAERPRAWEVGVRFGEAFRRARAEDERAARKEGEGRKRASPRPHIRRAHWHTYRVGKGRKDRVLKWLPPIEVGVRGENQPVVVREVRGR